MRRLSLAVSPLFLLLALAGCAHQNAGYAPASAGYVFDDCDFAQDCYGGLDGTTSSCVLFENPAAPSRLAVIVSRQRPSPHVVNRGDWRPGTSPTDSSGNGNSSAGSSLPATVAPAPIAREPVIVASPGEGRTPRTRD